MKINLGSDSVLIKYVRTISAFIGSIPPILQRQLHHISEGDLIIFSTRPSVGLVFWPVDVSSVLQRNTHPPLPAVDVNHRLTACVHLFSAAM